MIARLGKQRSISVVYVLPNKKCGAISRAKVYFALFMDL